MSLLHNTFFSKQPLLYPMSRVMLGFLALLSLPVTAFAQSAVPVRGMWFDIHLIAAMLTTGVFLVALLLAVVVYAQAKHLHNANELIREDQDSWTSRLPPMMAMERLLVRVLVLGFVLLSGLLLTGMFFGDAVWGAPLTWNHKTLFTIFFFFFIPVLLLGSR